MTFFWFELSPMRLRRVAPTIAELADGRVVVTAGTCYDDSSSRALGDPADEAWSPIDGAWRPLAERPPIRPPPPPAIVARYRNRKTTLIDGRRSIRLLHDREQPTSTRLDVDRVLVTGGFESFTNFSWEDYDDSVEYCEIVDFARGTTVNAGKLAVGRHAHAALQLACGAIVLIGGKRDDHGATASAEIGLAADFAAWDAFGPPLRDDLRARFDVARRKALLERASGARHDNDRETALVLATEASTRWPDVAETWTALGRVHVAAERWSDAVVAFRRAVELEPDDEFDWSYVGACAVKLGRFDEAEVAYARVVELIGDGDTWTGSIAREAKDQLQFLALARGETRAVADSPQRPTTTLQWNNKGVALVDTGRPGRALRCFDEALALDATNHFAHYNRSLALTKLGRHRDALVAVERAIARRADATPELRACAWVQRGIACHDLGDFAKSVASYDNALAAVETAIAHNNRGNSLFRLGHHAEALAAYHRAIALGFNAWWGVACVACADDRLDDARDAEARAIALDRSLGSKMRDDPDLRKIHRRRRQRKSSVR